MGDSPASQPPIVGQGQVTVSSQNHTGVRHIPPEFQTTLQRIVDDVVEGLGCVGAFVATLEPNNSLPVQAYSVDIAPGLLRQLETKLGVDVIGPKSVAYLDDAKFKDNLSIRAVKGVRGRPEKFVISDQLYDLFRPVVNKALSDLAQKLAGIKQVIAVPFFLEEEVVGNLFAATRTNFSKRDIEFLTAYGHQAATAIQSQRRLAEIQALERVILALQASITDEVQALQIIVDAVVQKLGYAGAMVATLEPDNTLPVRAYCVDIAPNLVKKLEQSLGIRIISPDSVAYLDRDDFKNNLAVRAINGTNGQPNIVTSHKLHDLFRPVVKKPLSELAQRFTGIKQVIAVPFFLEEEVVGNLFVATRRANFAEREKELLTTFGQQAAVGIRNARLYRKSEERRLVAQMFGKMAFSSAASVHTLRNHIGAFRIFYQMIKSRFSNAFLEEMGPDVIKRLDQAADILDTLHEPWRENPDTPTNINTCLRNAVSKVIANQDDIKAAEGIVLHVSMTDDLPPVKTSPHMLTEAFRVLIKNALETIREKNQRNGKGGYLWIESHHGQDAMVEILIRDSGKGIKPKNLNKIFELGWSTKEAGMGFGLFWTKDYIEGLGGTIIVESVWQKGTNFCIRLPAIVEQADP